MSSELEERREAAQALANHRSSQAVPLLIQILRNEKPEGSDKHYAGRALLQIGAASVLPLLEEYFTYESSIFARNLLSKEELGPDTIPEFLKALRHPKVGIRRFAASRFRVFGPEGRAATPALVDALLHDSDQEVRFWAAASLSEHPPGAEAIPALMGVVRNPGEDAHTRMSTAHTLSGIEQSLEPLEELLTDADSYVRLCAVAALNNLALEEPRAFAALKRAVRDESPEVREFAQDVVMSYENPKSRREPDGSSSEGVLDPEESLDDPEPDL